MKQILALILLASLTSCRSVKQVHRLIDQQDTHYWKGQQNHNSYRLEVEPPNGIWFTGYLTINELDTLFLRGFEKGSNHPTQVAKRVNGDTVHIGSIFIWTKGWEADTIEIKNQWDSIAPIPKNLLLTKRIKPSG